jgi:hypothetical protein
MRNWIGALALAAFSFVGVMGDARADGEYTVAAGKGQITVTAASGYHVNKEYPWKVVAGDKTFDKSKFTLAEGSASISGLPAGTVTLKGGVCNAGGCVPFTKQVTVQ